jgi:protein ImuB
MAFASIHVPNFMVQAVVSAEPELRGRAVALVDGIPPLSVVVALNEAARRSSINNGAGMQLGISESQAEEFCGVEIRKRSAARERALHAALLDVGWSVSPRIEDTAPDTILLDIAGLHLLFGSEENIADELKQRAAALGISANVAVSANLETALHAARGFSEITLIPAGKEASYLGSLPVHALNPSLEIQETLTRWGIRTCAQLAALPVLQLSERLGQEGVRLHELARGARVRSLVLAEPGICFVEEMELEDAVEDLEPLSFLLGRLLDQLCARLQARSLAAAAIHLRFDLGDFFGKEVQVRTENSTEETRSKVYDKVLNLPVAMRNSKTLLKLMRLQLQADPPHASIVKITLAADPARSRAAQGGLFRPSIPDPEKLELTVARLASLVGDGNIGSPELVDSHRPGNFRMSRFAPAREDSPDRRKKRGKVTLNKDAAKHSEENNDPQFRQTAIAFRIFRPEWPAKVELRESCPAHILFRGMRGNITAASGPWRTSGDWWREDAWQQDEWDVNVRLDFSSTRNKRSAYASARDGLYRIYYDALRQSWFVRGRYD